MAHYPDSFPENVLFFSEDCKNGECYSIKLLFNWILNIFLKNVFILLSVASLATNDISVRNKALKRIKIQLKV